MSEFNNLSEQRLVNGHHLRPTEDEWRCLDCGHFFECVSDAEDIRCGHCPYCDARGVRKA